MKNFLDYFLYIWMGVGRRRRISKADGKIVGADKQDI
jgi:hypothetical protein